MLIQMIMVKKIIAAGGIVINDKEEVLLIFRKGNWDLPKGKLDKGETIEDCAVREVEEETGLTSVQLGEFIGTTLHVYEEKGKTIHKTSYWYFMQVSGKQKLVPQIEESITDIKWIAPGKLKNKLKDTYQTIKDIVVKAGYKI